MHTKFIENDLKYTGLELAPHWIYKKFKLQGDAIVAFCGECKVDLSEMVDIEDVINNEPIYSKYMLNFIVEHFNIGLIEGVARQRLLICTIKEALEEKLGNKFKIVRKGDDIFVEGKKLSVSIATKSMTSVLIHTGVNIDAEGAPVSAIGLNDLSIQNVKDFANDVIIKYSNEIDDIILASTKVTGR